jgi:hypothetical protein
MFIPHEDCTPWNIVHPSTQGGYRGGSGEYKRIEERAQGTTKIVAREDPNIDWEI